MNSLFYFIEFCLSEIIPNILSIYTQRSTMTTPCPLSGLEEIGRNTK